VILQGFYQLRSGHQVTDKYCHIAGREICR